MITSARSFDVYLVTRHLYCMNTLLIGHVLNEQGTGYECLNSIGVKSESYHMKEHPRIIQIVKMDEKMEVNGGSLKVAQT